jgi:hypothetical protein
VNNFISEIYSHDHMYLLDTSLKAHFMTASMASSSSYLHYLHHDDHHPSDQSVAGPAARVVFARRLHLYLRCELLPAISGAQAARAHSSATAGLQIADSRIAAGSVCWVLVELACGVSASGYDLDHPSMARMSQLIEA